MQNIESFLQIDGIILDTLIDKVVLTFIDSTTSFKNAILSMADSNQIEQFDPKEKYFKNGYNIKMHCFRVALKSTPCDRGLSLILYQPTTGFQCFMNSVFKSYRLVPIFSYADLTWDSYHPEKEQIILLKQRYDDHVFHPRQRKDSRIKENDIEDDFDTLYSTSGKVSKKFDEYIRPFEGQHYNKGLLPFYFVRMELKLYRPNIRKLEWSFPILPEVIKNLLLLDYIRFYDFNYERFNKSMLFLKRKNDPSWNKFVSLMKELEKKNYMRINDCCKSFEKLYLMKKIETLRKSGIDYDRFLSPMENENNIFKEALQRKQGYDMPWSS